MNRARVAATRTARQVLRHFNLTIVRDPIPDTLPFELRRIFGALDVNCVLDVGANVGQFVELLRSDARYGGRIVSFEPCKEAFDALNERHGKDPMWSGYRWALGREAGRTSLNRYSDNSFNSFLPPSTFGSWRYSNALRVEGRETVDVYRLEDVFDTVTRGLSTPRVFLKTDTQGFDMEVLAGTGRYISEILGIQIEAPFRAVYEGAPSFLDVFSDLDQRGFDLAGVFPVSTDKDHIGIVEADCIFVTRSALAAPARADASV